MTYPETTDLDYVRRKAAALLYLDIEPTSIGVVVTHPFTNTSIIMTQQNRTPKFLDLTDPDQLRQWRSDMRQHIMQSKLNDILWMMNKPYILTMLHISRAGISNDDMACALRTHWSRIENITGDVNVKTPSVLKMFRRATPSKLMSDHERAVLAALPEQVTLYRGVTNYNRKHKKPLSWSSDRHVALSFANRFRTGYGELWTITVPKERILCFFDTSESEFITDLTGYKTPFNVEIITDMKKEG